MADGDVQRVRRMLADAQRVTVLTGAGVSTDSGIPDFRGPNGVWTRNPAAERMSTYQDYVAAPPTPCSASRSVRSFQH